MTESPNATDAGLEPEAEAHRPAGEVPPARGAPSGAATARPMVLRGERWGGGARSWYRAGALVLPLSITVGLLALTLARPAYNTPFFIATTYYALFALGLLYVGVRLTAIDVAGLRSWAVSHAAGLALIALVIPVVAVAVEPSFRVLADEANLVGVSKHLYLKRAAEFATTGKWYYESYWPVGTTTDRRPSLYPFLVSLLHVVRGYRIENAFHVNLAVFAVLLFVAYRLAKALGGELLGLVTALLIGAHPNVLVAARSAGFDLLATCFLVVIAHSFLVASRSPTPRRIAVLVLELCLLANVRYEGIGVLVLAVAMLVFTRIVTLARLRGYGWLYAWLPLLLLPRYWQQIAKANDHEQPLSLSLFGFDYLWNNSREFLGILHQPFDPAAPHAPLVLALGSVGLLLLSVQGARLLRGRAVTWPGLRTAVFVCGLVVGEWLLCFAYVWGRSLHPAAVRLFLWLDVTLAFLAAVPLVHLGRLCSVPMALQRHRSHALVPLLVAGALLIMGIPAASEARFINALTLTRQTSELYRFFSTQEGRRFVVLTDRPGMYTIRNWGAMDISSQQRHRTLLREHARYLFEDIYLVQEVSLRTGRVDPRFDPWPDVATETVLEFQNTESMSIRVARVLRTAPTTDVTAHGGAAVASPGVRARSPRRAGKAGKGGGAAAPSATASASPPLSAADGAGGGASGARGPDVGPTGP